MTPRTRRRRPAVGRTARRPVGRALVSVLAATLATSGLATGLTAPAAAAPVYELEGEWEANTPGQPGVADPSVARGEIVQAVFRANVNSDLPAPTNDPVPNVTARVTLQNGVFDNLPDVCRTGAGYTPRSSLSADRKTMVCNLGTVHEGTAAIMQTPIVASGPTGSNIRVAAEFGDRQVQLPPVPIVNNFGMDIRWQTTSTDIHYATSADGTIQFPLEWTLFQDRGSDAGPATVVYDLDIALANGQALVPGNWNLTEGFDQPCTPLVSSGATGHPYSARTPNGHEQYTLHPTCELVQLGATRFRMTLRNIDYTLAQVPSLDSTGRPLPVDRLAIASGMVHLKMTERLASNTSVSLRSSAPTYAAPTGQTDTDEPGNNTSNKSVVLPGDWSNYWHRSTGGTPWDDTSQHATGSEVMSLTTDYYAATGGAGNHAVGDCTVIDAQYVDYARGELWTWTYGDDDYVAHPAGTGPGTYQWYVGTDPTVTPGSGGYNPDAFQGCGGSAGWVSSEPADKTTIKAVRVTGDAQTFNRGNIQLRTFYRIQPDAPIGSNVWTWGSTIRGGQWLHLGRGAATDTGTITATPDERYPGTNGARDNFDIIYALPAISKSVDTPVLTRGQSAGFTLTYSANGAGAIPATVDDYGIRDVLPVGMTYVEGSATPAPDSITTDVQGRQVLVWTLDGVRTNFANTLTYRAVVGDVEPGQVLTNTVTSSLRGEESRPATAQVTTSTNGYTQISKVADTPFIYNADGSGDGAGSWTVNLRSFDPRVNDFTDVIDVLPWEGDERGTEFEGDYDLARVEILGATQGTSVWYTTRDPATISDDPRNLTNGNAPGTTAGNIAGWTTRYTPDATAVRVIGPALAPGATRQFRVHITTEGASPEDSYVNRAQGTAAHTRLAMRTSAPMQMAPMYSAALKKYVRDRNGVWHDAQDVTDYPAFRYGDTVRYRVVLTNTGQGTLRDIEVADDKQPQLGAFTIDTLAPGDSRTHEYEIVLDESTTDTVVNTASAYAPPPPDSGTNVPPVIPSDPAGIEVANYKTLKTSDPGTGTSVKPGDKVTYTVKVSQQGTVPAAASFTDDLSKVLDDATYNGDVSADIGEVRVADGMLSWNGTVPVDGVATVTYSVTVKPVAQLGDFGLDNVVTSDGCAVVNGATVDCRTSHDVGSFTYSKTSDPASTSAVEAGDTVTYTVRVKQRGQGAVPGASLVDDLSGVLDDATYNGDARATKGTVSVTGSTLSWNGDLAVGDEVAITYSVDVVEAGDDLLVNKVTSPNANGVCVPAPDGNADCTTTHPKAEWDLRIDKAAVSGPQATVGDNVRYRLTVTNRGEGAAPAPIKVVDRLPRGLELLSAKGKGWRCAVGTKTDNVVCKRTADLRGGVKAPRIIVVAKTTKAATGRVVNVASVSVLGDTVESNNKDKAAVRVKARPALPQTGFRHVDERTAWLGGMTR